jgi:PAS domain S-box-containing protein
MATSPDFVRIASGATRPLAETAFDVLREAVLIVDARPKHLPVVLANATARRCLLGDVGGCLVESSLYSLLGSATDSTMEAALGSHVSGKPSATRVLGWRFPRGETPVATELKTLAPALGQRMVMLTFAEPSAEPPLHAALEQLPLDLMILDRQLTVTYANAGATRTAGGMPGGILSYSGLTLVPTANIPRAAFARALNGGNYHDDALEVTIPGASTRWFEIDLQPLKDVSGIAGLAVLSTEVTERRSRKRSSTESERRLLALTEHARDIITVADRDGRLHYITGGILNSLGYTVEERRSNSIFEHMHPDDAEPIRAKFAQLVNGDIRSFSHQFRARHKNGSYRWLESNYVAALDNPLVNGVVINSRDITERRLAESKLAMREEVFKLASDAVNGVIFEWDLIQGTVHRSRGVREVLGIDAVDLAEEGAWTARVHPADRPDYGKAIAAALQAGRGWTLTYRLRAGDGAYRAMMERALIQRSEDGSPVRVIGCCVDVSEIKRLTNLLAEAQLAAKMGGWEYSFATRELTWTDEMYRIYETHPKEFAVSWEAMFGQCRLESRQRFDHAYAAAITGAGEFDLELEIVTLQGRSLWVRIIGRIDKQHGRPTRVCGSIQNIQAQKMAQIGLENSTGWLKLSMNMAHLHAWRWDRATDRLEFAIVDGQMRNLPRVFPGMKKLMAHVHPRDRLGLRRALDQGFERHAEVQEEFRLKSHSGRYRSYVVVARPLFDVAGQPTGMVGVTQDVTARQESEARLRRSEELLRTTTANTVDTLLLIDTDLHVRFINRDTSGMPIERIIGQSIAVLLPQPARDRVLAKLRAVLATGETASFEVALERDGEMQHLETRAVLVRDHGIGTGISITVRNITERKRLEQEILDVSSRERQTIGRDLHDGLGQELTGVALMLRGLATRIQKQCPDTTEQVNEIVSLVNQSIETARALARGLLPVNTESGGLGLALRSLADRSGALYGLKVDFRAEMSPEVILSETNASHLYRIAQEALTNTARHGRASAATLFLLVTKGKFLLRITDNGVGIGGTSRSGSGMGLKIMKYRASMIGAKIEIAPNYPHGTVVRVTGEEPMVSSALQSAHAI